MSQPCTLALFCCIKAHGTVVQVNLWGLDAIKTKGESVAIVLYLVGARPLREATGRVARYELIPLEASTHPAPPHPPARLCSSPSPRCEPCCMCEGAATECFGCQLNCQNSVLLLSTSWACKLL